LQFGSADRPCAKEEHLKSYITTYIVSYFINSVVTLTGIKPSEALGEADNNDRL
jgi:hypothetical protein